MTASGKSYGNMVTILKEGKRINIELMMLGSALCNDVFFYEKVAQANPVDQALITFAQEYGTDVQELFSRVNRFYEKPFDPENRYMALGIEMSGGESYYFAKGDPTVILEMCSTYQTRVGKVYKTDWEFRKRNLSQLETISQNGDSAIALAYASGSTDTIPAKYTFLCMFQFENPLQPGTRKVTHAMVGDGPNDGIALRVANIGISFVKNSSPIARRMSKILINNTFAKNGLSR